MSKSAGVPVLFPEGSEIPQNVRIASPIRQRTWLVNGELRTWEGPVREVHSPVCVRVGEKLDRVLLGSIPLMTEKESLEALQAATAAWDHGRGAWPSMSVEGRIKAVEAFTSKMVERRAEVMNLLMWEIGKTRSDSEKEFDRTVEYIRGTIEALKETDRAASRFTIAEGIYAQIRRSPLGVVLCMGPFNYPLNETFTTLIPALIMGNPVVFKPPKYGVLLFEPLLEAFQKSFPPGVVNTVYGEGRTVTPPLMASGGVDVLAFIGTSKAANSLKKLHPRPHHLRSVLGLDAKNPAILLEDVDLDLAVSECLTGALSFNGQRCTAIKIIFVHRKIAEAFLDKLCAAVDALKNGMPWEDGVKITPLPEEGKPDLLVQMVEDAEKGGASIANGGGQGAGTFYSPAVVYPVKEGMRLWSEEQFGPIVPVAVFDDIAGPLDYVVKSNYGQQVSLFGSDPHVLARLIDTLANQVCRVNLNTQCQRGPDVLPFTGRKDSAEGTLSISDALRVFSIRSLVAAKGTELNKRILKDILDKDLSRFLSTDFIF